VDTIRWGTSCIGIEGDGGGAPERISDSRESGRIRRSRITSRLLEAPRHSNQPFQWRLQQVSICNLVRLLAALGPSALQSDPTSSDLRLGIAAIIDESNSSMESERRLGREMALKAVGNDLGVKFMARCSTP